MLGDKDLGTLWEQQGRVSGLILGNGQGKKANQKKGEERQESVQTKRELILWVGVEGRKQSSCVFGKRGTRPKQASWEKVPYEHRS